MGMSYTLTKLNSRSPGPSGTFKTLPEAEQAMEAWIASMSHGGPLMAGMAGLEIRGPDGALAWSYRTPWLAVK
jgi:hypothetical protein